ncbi:hypothetical protein SAMN04488550_4139 [Gordonia malaquae]|nr:hypothetical protein SAMN04488550_4139 [Gordonia malaquae]
MRFCERCGVRRLADCSVLCFAERQHDSLATTDHTLYTSQAEDNKGAA